MPHRNGMKFLQSLSQEPFSAATGVLMLCR